MTEEKSQQWYNSRFFTQLGTGMCLGIGVLSLAIAIRGCDSPTTNQLEQERIRRGYVLQQEDLNHNRVPETFYEINNIKYFYSIDGKVLEDSLK